MTGLHRYPAKTRQARKRSTYKSPRGAESGKPFYKRVRLKRVVDGAGAYYAGELNGARVRVEKHSTIPDTLELVIEFKSALAALRAGAKTVGRNDARKTLDYLVDPEEAMTP